MALEREKHIAERALLTIDEGQLMDLYRRMVLIRRFEDKVAEMYSRAAPFSRAVALASSNSRVPRPRFRYELLT